MSGSHEFHHDLFSSRFKNGSEEKCLGQVMKGSAGKANPQQVNELLKAKLG